MYKRVIFTYGKKTHFLQRSRQLSPKIGQTTSKKVFFLMKFWKFHLIEKTFIVVIEPSGCFGQAEDKNNSFLLIRYF